MKTCKHPGGCARPTKGHGWCKAHLDRVRNTGKPGPAEIRPRMPLGRKCVIEDCDHIVKADGARGFCGMHYQRIKKHGDPSVVLSGGASLPRELNPGWTGDAASYNAVHQRLRNYMGRAADHQCHECGGHAAHWSYDNADPNERIDVQMGRYSPDLDHYQPRCVPCHSALDRRARALLTGERP